MKKLAYAIAAICTIAIAAPSIASAETVVIKRGHGWHHHMDRDWHRDRGWHQGWRHHDHDRVVMRHRD